MSMHINPNSDAKPAKPPEPTWGQLLNKDLANLAGGDGVEASGRFFDKDKTEQFKTEHREYKQITVGGGKKTATTRATTETTKLAKTVFNQVARHQSTPQGMKKAKHVERPR